MKYPEIKNNDLIDILKEPTQRKIEEITIDNINQLENKPEPNISDFEPEPKPQTETTETFNNPLLDEPQPQVKVKPKLTDKEYEEQAELTIAFFDGIQTLTLPWLYKKSIFTKEELIKLKKLKERYKKSEVELTINEQKLIERYTTYQELCDNIPFTEEEVNLLKTPLAKVYSKYNIQIGPEFMLLSAIATVMAPRIMPLFNKLERL